MSAYEELCDEIFLVVAAFMLRNLRNIFVYEGANGRLNNIVKVDLGGSKIAKRFCDYPAF